jgi:hypothetical protein
MTKTLSLRFVALLIIVILFSGAVRAQGRDVPVSFREDGLKKELTFRVKLSITGHEAEPTYSEKGFVLPSDVKAEKIRVRIAFCDKAIDFGEVDRELFDTEWVVGIDNKPYERSNVGHLPGPMREQGNIHYYVEFMSGGFIKYKITVFK